MATWFVGTCEDPCLITGKNVYAVFPSDDDHTVIYYQGRPAPRLSHTPVGRRLGIVEKILWMNASTLVAVTVRYVGAAALLTSDVAAGEEHGHATVIRPGSACVRPWMATVP